MAGVSATVCVQRGQVGGGELALRILVALGRGARDAAWRVEYHTDLLSMSILCDRDFELAGSLYDQLASRPFDATARSLLFHYVPIQRHDVLYLSCPELASSTNAGFGPSGACDVLHGAAVNLPFGDVLVAATPAGCWLSLPRVNTQTLSFQLRDRQYNVLAFPANISFDLWVQ